MLRLSRGNAEPQHCWRLSIPIPTNLTKCSYKRFLPYLNRVKYFPVFCDFINETGSYIDVLDNEFSLECGPNGHFS